MCYSVFIYSMRIELSTHSIATPVSANTASHMDGDLDRDRDGSQVGLHEHHICGLDCRICAAAHCRADVCTGEYGSIVDAVTDEHNRTALLADIGQRR